MNIRFECKTCAQHIEAPEQYVGTEVICPSCKAPLVVPSLSTLAPSPHPAAPDIVFSCHHCGQRLVVDASCAGIHTNCPSCATELIVPRTPSDQKPQQQAEDWAATLPCTKYELAVEWARRQRLAVKPVARFYDKNGTFWGQGYLQLTERLLRKGLLKQLDKGYCFEKSHPLYAPHAPTDGSIAPWQK